MAEPKNVIVYWAIQCFDPRKPKPLPLATKLYLLQEDCVTDSEKAAILSLMRRGRPAPSAHTHPTPERMETLSHDRRGITREVLRYRHLFRESSSAELQELTSAGRAQVGLRVDGISLPGYIEDENGNEVDELEMIDYMAGGGPTVILGNPRSVLRLGAADPKRQEEWTTDSADTIAHFLQVVDQIVRSAWFHAPLSITSADGKCIATEFPSAEVALGMLVLFRQLYSSDSNDDLFNRACGVYLRHVDNPGKAAWVKAEKSQFNSTLNRPPFAFTTVTYSVKDLLDAFLYGARIIHSRPQDTSIAHRLKNLITVIPRESLVMAFHSSMKYLLNNALTVYPVLRQDVLHWINDLGMAKPSLLNITDLLSGVPDRPER